MNQLKYYLRLLLAAPFMPYLYKKVDHIMNEMPDLPAPEDIIKQDKDSKVHILSLGESSIASIGVGTQEEGLTGYLAQQMETHYDINVSYEIVAKSGYTAAMVQDELLDNIQSKSADLIMIGLGANDTFKLTKPNKWRQDLTKILDFLSERFASIPIVFINMPPTTEFPVFNNMLKYFVSKQMLILRDELQQLLPSYPHAYYIANKLTAEAFIKKFNIRGKSVQDFYSDGVHPSRLTYDLWAREIFEFINGNVPLQIKSQKILP